MVRDGKLTVIKDAVGAVERLTRREAVWRMVAGAGARAAWPMVAASHPIVDLLLNDAIFPEAERLARSDWKPLFLDTQQNESLLALSESIVPGSMKAQVNRFIDLLLSVDTPEHKRSFVKSLSALEGESQNRFG